MIYKKITKTENKLQKTIQTAKRRLDRIRKDHQIIQEVNIPELTDWFYNF